MHLKMVSFQEFRSNIVKNHPKKGKTDQVVGIDDRNYNSRRPSGDKIDPLGKECK